MFAWDDLAVFLALYRERTTGRAAAALGVSQPTVVRRIAALEHALGITLFDRLPTGLNPTDAASRLFAAAEHVERGICEFTAEVESLTQSDLKLIRLTLLDHFEQLMVPVLRSFRTRWPAVHTELLPSNHMFDLARGEADMAIRGRVPLESDELVVRDLPPCGWAIYASAHTGPDERPHSQEEVSRYPLALIDGAPGRLPVYSWLETLVQPNVTAVRCSSFRALCSTIAAGAAISALPCTIGDGDSHLVRCFGPIEKFNVPVFLLARRAILRRPPARDLFDATYAYFHERPALLTGRRG